MSHLGLFFSMNSLISGVIIENCVLSESTNSRASANSSIVLPRPREYCSVTAIGYSFILGFLS